MSIWHVQIQKTRAAPAGEVFQHTIDEIFIDLPNVFGITDDILVVGYTSDGKDHDKTLWQVLQICKNVRTNAISGALQFHSLGRQFPG